MRPDDARACAFCSEPATKAAKVSMGSDGMLMVVAVPVCDKCGDELRRKVGAGEGG